MIQRVKMTVVDICFVFTFPVDGPEIAYFNSSQVVREGRNVTLDCSAEGNPEPIAEWTFQSQSKTIGMRETSLTISKVTSDNVGKYTCTARNDLGNITRTVSLTVESTSDAMSYEYVSALIEKWI